MTLPVGDGLLRSTRQYLFLCSTDGVLCVCMVARPSPFLFLAVAFQKPNFDAIHRERPRVSGKLLAIIQYLLATVI